MPVWKVPLADVRIPQEDIDAVVETYRSGWLSMGPETERFEAAFCDYTGAGEAVAVTNGTAALHLMCAAAGLGPGDEVIVPSLTFVATVNAVAYTGARPVFAEIAALDSPWLAAQAAAASISERTSAILTMTYGGHPGETEALAQVAARHGLVLLEDAAHAAGSRLDGRHLGRFGKAGAFSFFSNKNLAVGEGGMLTTDDSEFAARSRLLRSHGMTTLTWDRHRGHASAYDVVALGYNYRIDEPRAALGRARLARLDDENDKRRALDARYREMLGQVPGVVPTARADGRLKCACHLFTVVLDQAIDRDAVRAALAERGIQTSVHYPAAHHFSIYSDGAPELPLTDAYAARSMSLPMFADLTHSQQDLVIETLDQVLPVALSR